MTKYLYLYNLHCYNAPLISIELQSKKMTNCLNLQRPSFKAFTRSVIICEIISSISFQSERAKIHYFAGFKTREVIYFTCVFVFQINAETTYTDLKIKAKYVQVCVRVYCHFTNVLVSPISGEMNGT